MGQLRDSFAFPCLPIMVDPLEQTGSGYTTIAHQPLGLPILKTLSYLCSTEYVSLKNGSNNSREKQRHQVF